MLSLSPVRENVTEITELPPAFTLGSGSRDDMPLVLRAGSGRHRPTRSCHHTTGAVAEWIADPVDASPEACWSPGPQTAGPPSRPSYDAQASISPVLQVRDRDRFLKRPDEPVDDVAQQARLVQRVARFDLRVRIEVERRDPAAVGDRERRINNVMVNVAMTPPIELDRRDDVRACVMTALVLEATSIVAVLGQGALRMCGCFCSQRRGLESLNTYIHPAHHIGCFVAPSFC